MTIRAAIIENDTVTNVIVLDDMSQALESAECIEAPRREVEMGWARQPDGTFAPKEPE